MSIRYLLAIVCRQYQGMTVERLSEDAFLPGLQARQTIQIERTAAPRIQAQPSELGDELLQGASHGTLNP